VIARTLVLLAASVLLASAARADAQSLGEIARRDEARRARIRQPARVYTNKDLKRDYPAPDTSSGGERAASTGPASLPGTAANGASAAAKTEEGNTPLDEQEPQRGSDRGEDYWRTRADLLRSRMAAKNREIEVLRARVASLSQAADDPERAVAEQALSRAVNDLESFNQEWLRFERLARDQGVPDAWIR